MFKNWINFFSVLLAIMFLFLAIVLFLGYGHCLVVTNGCWGEVIKRHGANNISVPFIFIGSVALMVIDFLSGRVKGMNNVPTRVSTSFLVDTANPYNQTGYAKEIMGSNITLYMYHESVLYLYPWITIEVTIEDTLIVGVSEIYTTSLMDDSSLQIEISGQKNILVMSSSLEELAKLRRQFIDNGVQVMVRVQTNRDQKS